MKPEPNTGAVTAKEAIRRAFWMVKVPSMVLMAVPMVALYFATIWSWIPLRGPWVVPIFLLAFIGSWLAWSVQVPKWRLWAYERVDDIDELKVEAMAAQIIWSGSSIFSRTEIASEATRARIRQLEVQKRRSHAEN